jgi:competence ComEA-like helix-hairpin-helix protein
MSAPLSSSVTLAGRAWLGAAAALLAIQFAGWCVDLSARGGSPVSTRHLQLRIDPNRATAAELDLLPRVGEKIAENIIAYRESVSDAPAFTTAEDLTHVPRIGPVTVELLRPHLRFSSAADDAVESPTP